MENTSIVESNLVRPTSKKQLIQVGVGCLVVVITLYFIYRFIKNINKRFANLEEIAGRLIEKTNQLHHYIQNSRNVMPPIPPSPVPMNPPTQVPLSPRQATTTTIPPKTNTDAKPIDLDAELQAELEELTVPKPSVVEKAVEEDKKEDLDLPEGRLDN